MSHHNILANLLILNGIERNLQIVKKARILIYVLILNGIESLVQHLLGLQFSLKLILNGIERFSNIFGPVRIAIDVNPQWN